MTAKWSRLSPDLAPIHLWRIPGRRRIRSVWNDPIYWREIYDPGGLRIVVLVGLAILIPIVGWTVTTWDGQTPGITHGLRKVAHGYLLTLTLAGGVVVGLRSAVTLVDERVRGTLELLRLAGVEPASIMRSKLLAILLPAFALMPAIAAISFLTYGEALDDFVGPRAWLRASGHVAVAAAHALLVATVSLLISAFARSARVALLFEAILLLGIAVGPMMLVVSTSSFLPESMLLVLAASSSVYQVSIVGEDAARFPKAVLIGVLGAELVVSVAMLGCAGYLLEHRETRAVA